MPWEDVKNEAEVLGKQFIGIKPDAISFNVDFSKQAELRPGKYVKIKVDPEEFKLGFEFYDDCQPGSYSLMGHHLGKVKSMSCRTRKLMRDYPWVKRVSELRSVKDRRFVPRKEGNLWVIQLCPAFENRASRESVDIPSSAKGIYRYLRNGEIVYIGIGEIRTRLADSRENWDFDFIEYTTLPNKTQQEYWEGYWIRRFKEEHEGELPRYNRNAGSSKAD